VCAALGIAVTKGLTDNGQFDGTHAGDSWWCASLRENPMFTLTAGKFPCQGFNEVRVNTSVILTLLFNIMAKSVSLYAALRPIGGFHD
jgi:hypothetical protein